MRRDIYYWRPSHRFEAVLWLAARFASEDRRLCMRRLMASVGAGVPKKRCDPIRFFDHFFRQPDHADLSRQALFVLDCFIRAACSCDAAHQESESASVEVSVYTITAAPLTLTTDLPGRTTAFRAAGVRPQISGIVEHRLSPRVPKSSKASGCIRLIRGPIRRSKPVLEPVCAMLVI